MRKGWVRSAGATSYSYDWYERHIDGGDENGFYLKVIVWKPVDSNEWRFQTEEWQSTLRFPDAESAMIFAEKQLFYFGMKVAGKITATLSEEELENLTEIQEQKILNHPKIDDDIKAVVEITSILRKKKNET